MRVFGNVLVSFSLLCTIMAVIAPFGISPANAMPPDFPPFMLDNDLRDLSSEAVSLAIIHHLSLTPDQRTEIKQILTPLRAEFDLMKSKDGEFQDTYIKPRLNQIISDLKAGKDPDPPLEQNMAVHEAFRSQMAALLAKAHQAFEEISALLSPEQQEQLQSFRFEEYLGLPPIMHPRRLLDMEPVELIRQIRDYSPEEIDQLAEMVSHRQQAMKSLGVRKEHRQHKEDRIQMFISLIKKINEMPQSEFDAKAQLLQEEIEALSPPHHGPGKSRGRPGPPSPPFMKKGFDTKRIIMSEPFYEAL